MKNKKHNIKNEIREEIKRLKKINQKTGEYEIEIEELKSIIEIDLRSKGGKEEAWRHSLCAAMTGNYPEAEKFSDYFFDSFMYS